MNKIKVLILFLAICSVANGAIEHNETKNDNEPKARKEMDKSNFSTVNFLLKKKSEKSLQILYLWAENIKSQSENFI